MTFERLFHMALDRPLPELITPPIGPVIELGASGKKVHVDSPLGLPYWSWPSDRIPYSDGTAAMVHAYHFFEHLTGEEAISMLQEIQRVLMVGGVCQFAIPHRLGEMAYQDLTHKSFWTESSFRMLMANDYYSPVGNFKWKLRVHYLVIAGIVERNLCLMGQLVKEE